MPGRNVLVTPGIRRVDVNRGISGVDHGVKTDAFASSVGWVQAVLRKKRQQLLFEQRHCVGACRHYLASGDLFKSLLSSNFKYASVRRTTDHS